jgi:peptidoglycan hydrolase CwlO-like protein
MQKFKKEAEDAQKEIDNLDAKINDLEADPSLI